MKEIKDKYQKIIQKPPLRLALIIAVLGSLATLGMGLYQMMQMQQNNKPIPVVTPTISPIKYISALGRLEPEGEVVKVSTSGNNAKVQELLVNEGDKIEKGQIIAILDTQKRLQANVEKAKQQIKVAQANLAQVKAGAKQGEINAQQAEINKLRMQRLRDIDTQKAEIARLEAQKDRDKEVNLATVERLKADLDNTKKECDRYTELFKEGGISESTKDSKCLAYKTSEERVKEAQATLKRIEETTTEQIKSANSTLNRIKETGREQINSAMATLNKISEVRPEDIKIAQSEVENAIAALKQAEADLDLVYIKAPFSGQVLKIYTKPGEIVNANGIIELGKTGQMYAIAEVYESDIGKVTPGKTAIITSKGFKWKLKGVVNSTGLKVAKKDVLNTDPAADVDARIVEVKIKINPQDSEKVRALTYLKVEIRINN